MATSNKQQKFLYDDYVFLVVVVFFFFGFFTIIAVACLWSYVCQSCIISSIYSFIDNTSKALSLIFLALLSDITSVDFLWFLFYFVCFLFLFLFLFLFSSGRRVSLFFLYERNVSICSFFLLFIHIAPPPLFWILLCREAGNGSGMIFK